MNTESTPDLVQIDFTKVEITFVLIATGDYYNYARSLIKDIEEFFTKTRVQILIFTDRKFDLLRSEFHIIDNVAIMAESWPEITLFRFNKILRNKELIRGKYVVWTDADMRLTRKFDPGKFLSSDSVALSRHPGFSFSLAHIFLMFLRRPHFILVWIQRCKVIAQHRSSSEGWEINKGSAAFVPFNRRKIYVQGGFWIATREGALLMCERIQEQILTDLQIAYVPIYHDETYLNWYMASFSPSLLPRDFVGAEGYSWQNLKKSYIMCVDKSKDHAE